MPRILIVFTALIATLAVAAGCGNDSSSSSGAASLAPGGSLVYAEATLDPEADQQAAAESLIEKFPGEGSARDRIRGLMESAFSDSGLSYEKDVEPWLGDEAAFFVSNVSPAGGDASGAALVATEDEGKTEDAIEKAGKGDAKKASYRDHDYHAFDGDTAVGVLDGWLVVGNAAGFKAAVDASEDGKSIEDNDRYETALADAPEERLGFVYVNSPAFVEQLQSSSAGATLGQFGDLFKDPFVATVNADSDGVRLEAVVPESLAAGLPMLAEGSDLVGELPADSWLALAQPELGKTLEQFVDLFAAELGGRDAIEQQLKQATGLDLQEDVISWMGDWGLFVRGTTLEDLSGGLIIETTDEAASKRAIDAVARLARQAASGGEKVGPLDLPAAARA